MSKVDATYLAAFFDNESDVQQPGRDLVKSPAITTQNVGHYATPSAAQRNPAAAAK
jgi:hypothetical protein